MVAVKKNRFFVIALIIALLFGGTQPVQAGFWGDVCSAFRAVVQLVGAALDAALAPVRDWLKDQARAVMKTADEKAQNIFKEKTKELVAKTKKELLDQVDLLINDKFTNIDLKSIFPALKNLKGNLAEHEKKLNVLINKEIVQLKATVKKECSDTIDKCSEFLGKITLELLAEFIKNVTDGLVAKIDAKVRS